MQGDEVNISLPDIEITPRDNLNLASSVTQAQNNFGNAIKEAATYVTPLGDAEEAYSIYQDIDQGDYSSAAIGLGLMAMPNMIGKPLKQLGLRAVRSLSKKLTPYQRRFVIDAIWHPFETAKAHLKGEYPNSYSNIRKYLEDLHVKDKELRKL